MLTGQREIEQAKVRTYRETGRLIGEHLRLNEAKPGYGTATMSKLSHDLKVSDSVLYRCMRFVESLEPENPDFEALIPAASAAPALNRWSHWREATPRESPALGDSI